MVNSGDHSGAHSGEWAEGECVDGVCTLQGFAGRIGLNRMG